jgi:hypothetical protein
MSPSSDSPFIVATSRRFDERLRQIFALLSQPPSLD